LYVRLQPSSCIEPKQQTTNYKQLIIFAACQ
jgi:hypothetical protein